MTRSWQMATALIALLSVSLVTASLLFRPPFADIQRLEKHFEGGGGVASADHIPDSAAIGRIDGGLIPNPVFELPAGPAKGTIFLFSEGPHWSAADALRANRIRDAGAAVVGIDTDNLLASLERQESDCVYLVSDIERIGHEIGRLTAATSFVAPIVAGSGVGGALAMDLLAGTPADTIGAVAAVDPAAGVPLRTPLCSDQKRQGGPEDGHYDLPAGAPPASLSVVLTDAAKADTRARVAAMQARGVAFKLQTAAGAPASAALTDTTLRAVAAASSVGAAPAVVELAAKPTHDAMAIVLSGDGGWRDLDRSIAEVLQKDGVPTLGLDTLHYFWSKRTPEETAADLARLIHTYAGRWGVSKVLLVGYSFGADVLPQTWGALPADVQAKVAQISLLGLSDVADWEITVSGWLGSSSSDAQPVGPALVQMPAERLQCVYGAEETDSACPSLAGTGAELIETKGGHHFDGDYTALAAKILGGFERRAAGQIGSAHSSEPALQPKTSPDSRQPPSQQKA